MFFILLFSLFIVLDVWWWRWADAQLRPLQRARWWRSALAVWMTALMLYMLAFVIFPRQARAAHQWLSVWYLALAYVWHLLIMPVTLLLFVPGRIIGSIARWWKRWRTKLDSPIAPSTTDPMTSTPATSLTRRQLLSAAAVALPPLVASGAVIYSVPKLHDFRVRRLDIASPRLPPALDGLTIAHLSDVHIGKFTTAAMLRDVIARTNALRADLVFFTGDLIDLSLAELTHGIEMLRNIDPRGGFFICEGNHDLIEDRNTFEQRMEASGLPILLGDSRTIDVRGEKVQILGQRWTRGGDALTESSQHLFNKLDPTAYSILLAHHPNAWDPARGAGIPLTLSGHTHGGQLMLNERLGAGPVVFKYWSGLYQRNNSALVVSNGIGNWFPLRIGSPAEIIHMTLRRT